MSSANRPFSRSQLDDLFSQTHPVPLAEALRPKKLAEVIGQQHLLGPGKPLRLAFEARKLHSLILWGPPGVGKTTLARLMADAFDAEFVALSAVFSGVKDIREAVARAEVARACRQALPDLRFDDEARSRLVGQADGDARRLINLLEQTRTAAATSKVSLVDGAFIDATLAQSLRRFDKGGDAFYDQISALHKSVRGSNPDAALYWLCRMLDGGADPRYLARRIVRMAWEDIGLADPRAAQIAAAAAETYERLGSPEGELVLAEAVIYLALAAKSNAAYVAYNAARGFVAKDASRPVPMHLRNAPTRLMKALDYGKDYRYAHDETEGYAAGENYFPEGMPPVEWYRPVGRGLEIKIAEKLARLRELDREAPAANAKKPKNTED